MTYLYDISRPQPNIYPETLKNKISNSYNKFNNSRGVYRNSETIV